MVEVNLNNKGSSKRHKTDEKCTLFAVHVHQSIFEFFLMVYYTQYPFKNAVSYIFLKLPMLTEKRAPPFCHFFGVFSFNPTNVYLFVEL